MPSNKKDKKGILVYIVVIMGLIFAAHFASTKQPFATNADTLKYSEVLNYFEQGDVTKFTLNLGTGEIEIYHTREGNEKLLTYRVPYVTWFVNDISGYVEEYNAEHPTKPMVRDYIRASDQNWILEMLPSIILIIGCGVVWYMMLKQTRGGGAGGNVMGFGKAKTKMGDAGRKVFFKDVAGAVEEKEELVEIVEFLKNPTKFNALGARIPKGVLLVGPPGTGKTLLARAVAGEANVPFFSISGSDFVEMFVGVGASRVRDLFDQAKKTSPSIIFIDEIDAVGRKRGAGLGGGHDEREQTLNQLLVEMDGFGVNSGVIIIAATNRKDILDPALLRPGRFDRQIYVGYPDIKGREEILQVHTRNKPLAPDVALGVVARSTRGFTGADLENIVNEGALLAARKNRKAITMADIEEATMKVRMGPEKRSNVKSERNQKLTAYHEAGHAICYYALPTHFPVHEVSIISRGNAGGYTMGLPEDDDLFSTKKEMEERIVSAMGGRVAEEIVLGDISTGASGDIDMATKMARAMVTVYGFSDVLGPIAYSGGDNEVFLGRDFSQNPSYSQETAARIDEEVQKIINNALNEARRILNKYRTELDKVAEKLLEVEKIDGEEFTAIMEGREVDLSKATTLFGLKKYNEDGTEVSAENEIAPSETEEKPVDIKPEAEAEQPKPQETENASPEEKE